VSTVAGRRGAICGKSPATRRSGLDRVLLGVAEITVPASSRSGKKISNSSIPLSISWRGWRASGRGWPPPGPRRGHVHHVAAMLGAIQVAASISPLDLGLWISLSTAEVILRLEAPRLAGLVDEGVESFMPSRPGETFHSSRWPAMEICRPGRKCAGSVRRSSGPGPAGTPYRRTAVSVDTNE